MNYNDWHDYKLYKMLDAIDYLLDNYCELKDPVFAGLMSEVGNSYEPRNSLTILRNILRRELAK